MTTIKLISLLLAKIVVGEAGWNATEDDVMAHHTVIVSRTERRGWTYAQAAKKYSKRHTGVVFNPRRPWIAELDRSMKKPPTFNLSWSVHKPKWKRILELAEKAHAGELEQKCIADHWGSPNHPIDRARIKKVVGSGEQIIVDCGNTRNIFLRINDNFHSTKLQRLDGESEKSDDDGEDCGEEVERLHS